MSWRNSIFLTSDNEHCYEDGLEPIHNEKGDYIGDTIFLEINPDNCVLEVLNNGYLNIKLINPESEIYKLIMLLKDKEETIR